VLTGLRDPKNPGADVIEWVAPREEVVSGDNIHKYPAILFKLAGDYGTDFGLFGGLFAPDVNHRRISGGHKPVGVFASSTQVSPPESIEAFYDFIVERLDAYAGSSRQ
jgi:hypothetical protein